MGESQECFRNIIESVCTALSLSFGVGVWVLWCRVVPPGGRELQGVVVAILGFAELVKEKDDSLKAKD